MKIKNEIILVTGGCRSGKSQKAESLAHDAGERKLYIATAPVLDDEMKERVKLHQDYRKDMNWVTVEEEINIAEVIRENPRYDAIPVDCLTLWINNLMYKAEQGNLDISEEILKPLVSDLINAAKEVDGRVIFVINEVGMGIVPENKVSRLFRDLSGRCAQIIASKANRVLLMSCGLPINIK